MKLDNKIEPFIAEGEKFLSRNESQWISKIRLKALRDVKNHRFPSRKNESWKYTDCSPVVRDHFHVAKKSTNIPVVTANIPDLEPHVFVFIDGKFSQSQSHLYEVEKGCVVSTLASAFKENSLLVKKYLNTLHYN